MTDQTASPLRPASAAHLELGQAALEHEAKAPASRRGATSVAVVTSRAEAELIAGLLRSHDLLAVVSADDAGGLEPQLQAQGVRVLVPPADAATARRLLDMASRPGDDE
jgi:hypothetical protein